jgi:hypothetical protein
MLAGVAHVRALPGVHLAAQHIQVGFRPDLGVRWLLCSRAPSGANLAELATLLLAGGDAVGSDIILTMFNRTAAFDQDLGTWDAASPICPACSSVPVRSTRRSESGIRTANVRDMQVMFSQAAAFDQDIGYWNTARVAAMFLNATQARSTRTLPRGTRQPSQTWAIGSAEQPHSTHRREAGLPPRSLYG